MCLAVPLRIKSINGNEATGEIEGVERSIRVDFVKNLKEGDYVLVHAGFALEILDKEQVEENLDLIKEVADAAMGSV